MKTILKYFKRSSLIFKVLLLGYSVSGQIYTWGDISSSNKNYTVISVVEGKANQIFVLGKVTDKNQGNPQIGYSCLSNNGDILFTTVYTDQPDLYNLNSILFQPDGLLRIYGTSYLQSGMMAPYMACINPESKVITNTILKLSTPQSLGDVKLINNKEIILANASKGLSTGIFNIFASRTDLTAKDLQKINVKLDSKFNEEPKSLCVLHDSSFYILGKRYSDQSMTKSEGMIYYISSDFKMKWNMEVLNSSGLSDQCLSCGKDGWIYYFCSFKDKNTGTCSSKGFIFDKDGNKLRQILIDSNNVHSILTLKNGNILVAGTKIQKDGSKTLEKAHYIIYDRTLKKIKSRTLGLTDKPDVDLPQTQISAFQSSSDYTTSIQLSNGKILLGGRIFLPINTSPDKIINSTRAYKYLVVILTANGDL